MKEIYNLFYCRICNSINKIRSNFTKSKKIICNNCENVFYYELLFCKKCNKTTYCTKLDPDTQYNLNYNRYICICNEIYILENKETYTNNCCSIS
jgi:hypothetical protein